MEAKVGKEPKGIWRQGNVKAQGDWGWCVATVSRDSRDSRGGGDGCFGLARDLGDLETVERRFLDVVVVTSIFRGLLFLGSFT